MSNPIPLPTDQIEALLPRGWSFLPEEDKIRAEWHWGDFNAALGFMVRVGLLAEVRGHHPEMFNCYARVELKLTTHDAGNRVTMEDVMLAQAISAIA